MFRHYMHAHFKACKIITYMDEFLFMKKIEIEIDWGMPRCGCMIWSGLDVMYYHYHHYHYHY